MQQRADGKYHSGGLWANTCCSHPRWNESLDDCAHRRQFEELGCRTPVAVLRSDRLRHTGGSAVRERGGPLLRRLPRHPDRPGSLQPDGGAGGRVVDPSRAAPGHRRTAGELHTVDQNLHAAALRADRSRCARGYRRARVGSIFVVHSTRSLPVYCSSLEKPTSCFCSPCSCWPSWPGCSSMP